MKSSIYGRLLPMLLMYEMINNSGDILNQPKCDDSRKIIDIDKEQLIKEHKNNSKLSKKQRRKLGIK